MLYDYDYRGIFRPVTLNWPLQKGGVPRARECRTAACSCDADFMVRFCTLVSKNLCVGPNILTEKDLIRFKSGPDYERATILCLYRIGILLILL